MQQCCINKINYYLWSYNAEYKALRLFPDVLCFMSEVSSA